MKLFAWDDLRLVQILLNGGVIVAPTDTVYGLLANAADAYAVKRMLALKGRTARPGTVIAGSVDQILDLGVESDHVSPFKHLWPAPLSVVIPTPPVLGYITAHDSTFAVRVPMHDQLLFLLQSTGPLMTTSANLTGHPVAATPMAAYEVFGDMVDAYIDGVEVVDAEPSTIAKVINGKIVVLRQGAFPAHKLV
jgi:L-threonylcarbamoyladenylate synthase